MVTLRAKQQDIKFDGPSGLVVLIAVLRAAHQAAAIQHPAFARGSQQQQDIDNGRYAYIGIGTPSPPLLQRTKKGRDNSGQPALQIKMQLRL